jgi:hypothetical protein
MGIVDIGEGAATRADVGNAAHDELCAQSPANAVPNSPLFGTPRRNCFTAGGKRQAYEQKQG